MCGNSIDSLAPAHSQSAESIGIRPRTAREKHSIAITVTMSGSFKDLDGDGIVSFDEYKADVDMDPGLKKSTPLPPSWLLLMLPTLEIYHLLYFLFFYRRGACHQGDAGQKATERHDRY